jgi:hypothetical protein
MPFTKLALFSLVLTMTAHAGDILDSIQFGDAVSEAGHHLVDQRSVQISGSLGEPGRQLLAPEPVGWDGGRISFKLAVDPAKQNYATDKLWGSDATENQLVLFCDGKQVGYRHLGDIDILDIGGGDALILARQLVGGIIVAGDK